jgi:hypothetical protein
MARDEHDREDLLTEAKALVQRVSLRPMQGADQVVLGFRRDGGAAFYLSGDRVYQFNSSGELRRAFVDGLLYKAERGALAALRRERTARAVSLVRHELSAREQQAFLADVRQALDALRESLARRDLTIVGQVPADADVVGRVHRWLAEHAGPIVAAQSPRAG